MQLGRDSLDSLRAALEEERAAHNKLKEEHQEAAGRLF